MNPPRSRRRPRPRPPAGERGVLLVALMVGITVMMILLTASAQSWTAVMKREREEELIFRGNQYVKALRAYGAEHGGTFPTELKALMEKGPGGKRYIRQLFKDPFDPKGEWNLLFLAPDGKSAWNPHARLPQGIGGSDPLGLASNPGGGGLGSRNRGGMGSTREGSLRGNDPGFGSQGGAMGSGGVAGSGMPGAQGAQPGPGGGSGGRRSRFASGNLNTPIVGVVSRGTDKGFREYQGKEYYDEWEFHVFSRDIPAVQGQAGPVPGLNINPSGSVGPPGMSLVNPKDPSSFDERPGGTLPPGGVGGSGGAKRTQPGARRTPPGGG